MGYGFLREFPFEAVACALFFIKEVTLSLMGIFTFKAGTF